MPVGVGCHGSRQAPPVPQPAGRWRRGASVPTKVLGQQQTGLSISRQKCCWAAIQCGHVSHAPEPTRSAGLARKAPLPACVLNCMPLADVSQNPYLYSQFFRSFRDYKRMGLAKITSLSGRNSELTLQSRLPLPSLPTPLSSLGLTSLQDQEEESQLIISRTLGRGFKEGQQLLLR